MNRVIFILTTIFLCGEGEIATDTVEAAKLLHQNSQFANDVAWELQKLAGHPRPTGGSSIGVGHSGPGFHTTHVKCANESDGAWTWLKRSEQDRLWVSGNWVRVDRNGWVEGVFLINGAMHNVLVQRCINDLGYERVVAGDPSDAYSGPPGKEGSGTWHKFVILECHLFDFRDQLMVSHEGSILCPLDAVCDLMQQRLDRNKTVGGCN